MKNTWNDKKILAVLLIISLCVNIGLAISLGIAKKQIRRYYAETAEFISSADSETVLDGNSNARTKKKSKRTSEANDSTEADAGITRDEILEANIRQILTGKSGTWDIWVESLADYTYSQVRQGTETGAMISASLIKLFIMATVFQEIQNGTIQESAVSQDLNKMITISDNDATNRLIRLLGSGDESAGCAKVNDYCASIGCVDTHLNRLMLEENGRQNYTSAKDCATILRMIYSGECVDSSSSDEMMEILSQQTVSDRIPQGIDSRDSVAHKTGNLTNLSNGDVGIVHTAVGDYILCIIANNYSDEMSANSTIIQITQATNNYFKAATSA